MKNVSVSAFADEPSRIYYNKCLMAWALALAYMPIFGMFIKMLGS